MEHTTSTVSMSVGNRLHHRRDGSSGEDACPTRTGASPGLLVQLNSKVLSLMDRAGVRNAARQMRYFDAHVEQALALLLTGHCSVYENRMAPGAGSPH
jgi:hypothetical protein